MPSKCINFTASLAARCGHVTKIGPSRRVVERVCLIAGDKGRRPFPFFLLVVGMQPG